MDHASLTELFRALGAPGPEEWAHAQRRSPETIAKYMFLRGAWENVLTEGDTTWIDEWTEHTPEDGGGPYDGVAHSLRRLIAAGADPHDLTELVRAMQAQTLHGVMYLLGDPGTVQGNVDFASWSLFESNDEQEPVRPLGMLHESVLHTDPTGRDMQPVSTTESPRTPWGNPTLDHETLEPLVEQWRQENWPRYAENVADDAHRDRAETVGAAKSASEPGEHFDVFSLATAVTRGRAKLFDLSIFDHFGVMALAQRSNGPISAVATVVQIRPEHVSADSTHLVGTTNLITVLVSGRRFGGGAGRTLPPSSNVTNLTMPLTADRAQALHFGSRLEPLENRYVTTEVVWCSPQVAHASHRGEELTINEGGWVLAITPADLDPGLEPTEPKLEIELRDADGNLMQAEPA